MKITVRFELTEEDESWAKVFLNSLGLSPFNWEEDQEFESDSLTTFDVFNNKLKFPGWLSREEHWTCTVRRGEGSLLFLINDRPIGALLKHELMRGGLNAGRVLSKLPVSINALSILGLGFERIENLSIFSELSALNLDSCEDLKDISQIEGCINLKTLNMAWCESLSEIAPIRGMVLLEHLDLGCCRSLTDLTPISALSELKYLDLSGDMLAGTKITDLSPLRKLRRIEVLKLGGNKSLSDLTPLSELSSLKSLDLGNARSVSEISPLGHLTALENLVLTRSKSLEDLTPLASLILLTKLDLGWCESVSNIVPLSGLVSLRSLDLSMFKSLSDIAPLTRLTSLTSLSLWGCDSLSDISPLAGLVSLKSLDLSLSRSLKDIGPLSGLSSLSSLKLSSCDCLSEIEPLSCLKSLMELDLSSSDSLDELAPLVGLHSLETLNINGLTRLKSLEHLRGVPSLVSLISNFHPWVVAELMAWNASQGRNRDFIRRESSDWLSEAEKYGPEDRGGQEKLVRSLGMAFSLLDEGEQIIPQYESLLDAHPEFEIAPWKAWFLGTKENSGFELLRKRIERIPVTKMFPSAIGGACAAMPDQGGPAEEVQWARGWLVDLESEQSSNAKELLSVAPEICLAYARLGEMEALGRWLERLTDPSDPEGLDELQVSLAKWHLLSGDLQKARSHISAIHSPSARDPILWELVMAELSGDPDTASEDLLMIQGSQTRSNLAKKLATEPIFTNSESRCHRLLVAAGENPTALAELITLLGASVPSEIVNRLSAQLGLPQAELQQWRINQLESVLLQMKAKKRLNN